MANNLDSCRELIRMGMTMDEILKLDIPSLNKEINKKSLSHEECKFIKEMRKKYKKREYARRRHRETTEAIENLQEKRVKLRTELENLEYEVVLLRQKRRILEQNVCM